MECNPRLIRPRGVSGFKCMLNTDFCHALVATNVLIEDRRHSEVWGFQRRTPAVTGVAAIDLPCQSSVIGNSGSPLSYRDF